MDRFCQPVRVAMVMAFAMLGFVGLAEAQSDLGAGRPNRGPGGFQGTQRPGGMPDRFGPGGRPTDFAPPDQERPDSDQDANDDAPTMDIASLPPENRDPFWPVGFVPQNLGEELGLVEPEPVEVVPEEAKPTWPEAQKLLKVGGVMKHGSEDVAVVNDQVVKKGDRVAVELGGNKYIFTINDIKDGSVYMKKHRFVSRH